jgi:N-acetylgalactosamine PTS system EIIA component
MSEKGGERGGSGRSSGASMVVRAIVAGHGDFSAGLVSAIQQITGRGGAFRAVSANNLSASDLEALIERAIDETGAKVVFTDLQAGSCTMAARRLSRSRPDVLLIAGANLPMLLDFVFADHLPAVEAAKHALERGRAAMTEIRGPTGEGR